MAAGHLDLAIVTVADRRSNPKPVPFRQPSKSRQNAKTHEGRRRLLLVDRRRPRAGQLRSLEQGTPAPPSDCSRSMSFARGGRRLEPGRGRALFRHPGSPRRRIRRHPVGRRSRLRHPTRFGNLSSQLKQFLDTLGGVWVQGLLVGDSSRFARAAPSGRYGLCNDRRQQHLGGSARRGGRHRRAHGCERLTSCSARSVELRRVLPPGSCQELRYVRRPHRRPPGGVMAARYPADRPARPVPDHDANGSLLDPHRSSHARLGSRRRSVALKSSKAPPPAGGATRSIPTDPEP